MHPVQHIFRHATVRRYGPVVGVALLALIVMLAFSTQLRRAQNAVLRADPETILDDPAMRKTALAGGRQVYVAHCAACHGDTGKADPSLGVPDLTDDESLYEVGLVAEIEDLVRHGIRAHDRRGANLASMPAYAQKVPYKGETLPSQTPAQIEDLTQGLLSFTGRATDAAAAARGRALYSGSSGCWDCHGGDAAGDAAIGAPTLTDDIWLYGGSHDDIYRSIARGRAGVSPAFARTLTAAELRNVAVYVASLAPRKAGSK